MIYKKNTLESERKNNDIAEFYYCKRLNNTSELTQIYGLFSFDSSFSLRVLIFNRLIWFTTNVRTVRTSFIYVVVYFSSTSSKKQKNNKKIDGSNNVCCHAILGSRLDVPNRSFSCRESNERMRKKWSNSRNVNNNKSFHEQLECGLTNGYLFSLRLLSVEWRSCLHFINKFCQHFFNHVT